MMKRQLILSSVMMLFFALYSCITPARIEEPGVTVSHSILKEGALHGDGQEGLQGGKIANSKEEWKSLQSQMNTVNNVTDGIAVDLHTQTVVGYFDKVRSTAGYSISITSVQEFSSKIVVTYRIKGPEGPAAEVITQPFVLLTIPKTSKKIVFQSIS
jgi:hypothetical protein